MAGHVRAADRETAARLEPFGLQAGKGRAVEEKIVDDRGAQHRSSVEETILEADVARNAATFEVQFSDHASAADSQPLLVQAGAFVTTKNEEANELGANDSRRIVPLRAQAIAQPFEISRPQFRKHLGLGWIERLKIGEAGRDRNDKSNLRSGFVHAPCIRLAWPRLRIVSAIRARPPQSPQLELAGPSIIGISSNRGWSFIPASSIIDL
ncbi:hypothetical protein ACG873_17645 [Mesorhizobium sp. AaZ16]